MAQRLLIRKARHEKRASAFDYHAHVFCHCCSVRRSPQNTVINYRRRNRKRRGSLSWRRADMQQYSAETKTKCRNSQLALNDRRVCLQTCCQTFCLHAAITMQRKPLSAALQPLGSAAAYQLRCSLSPSVNQADQQTELPTSHHTRLQVKLYMLSADWSDVLNVFSPAEIKTGLLQISL